MDTSNKSDKPKIVTSIDLNIQWPPKVSKTAWLEESIQDHLNCVLCGTALTFKHSTDFLTQQASEEANCPTCGVRNRKTTHALQ